MRHAPARLDRRRFVAGAVALPACGLALPTGGAFAGGGDRIRVGLVGCGGRGTGAALQAVAAAPGVEVTALADAFADQVESSARVLAARAGAAFVCPPERRFVGLEAWRRVVESDVDIVILATPPVFRPRHTAAAVAAGKHVWCERPAAVDVAGVHRIAAACATAAARGLSFAAGLGERHDPVTATLVRRIRDGAAGSVLSVTVRADLGLPWHRPARPGWTAADSALRNWIACDRFSGGHLVEHHVDAIDKALWVLGDRDPAAVVPGPDGGVRLLMDDGRHVDAALSRREGASGRVEQLARCTGGTRDLRRPADAPLGPRHPLQAAMTALVAAVRSGGRLDEAPRLCRATLAAVAGRMALETGRSVAWPNPRAGAPSLA